MNLKGENDVPMKTIVVVGAGAAGLEAARVLLDHEASRSGRLKVILLEARDRVGGRIFVDKKWGVPFDHGMLISKIESDFGWSKLDSRNGCKCYHSFGQARWSTFHLPR